MGSWSMLSARWQTDAMSEGVFQPDQPPAALDGEGRDLFSKFDELIVLTRPHVVAEFFHDFN